MHYIFALTILCIYTTIVYVHISTIYAQALQQFLPNCTYNSKIKKYI